MCVIKCICIIYMGTYIVMALNNNLSNYYIKDLK